MGERPATFSAEGSKRRKRNGTLTPSLSLHRGQSPEAAATVALYLDSHRSQKNMRASFGRWRDWPSRGTSVVPLSGLSKLFCAERLPQNVGCTGMSLRRRDWWGAPTPGWVGIGAPGDQEDFVIETAGTVLLRSEICMCFTPLPGLRTHVCIALDPGRGAADSIAVTNSSIKSLDRSESRLRSSEFHQSEEVEQ